MSGKYSWSKHNTVEPTCAQWFVGALVFVISIAGLMGWWGWLR